MDRQTPKPTPGCAEAALLGVRFCGGVTVSLLSSPAKGAQRDQRPKEAERGGRPVVLGLSKGFLEHFGGIVWRASSPAA